MNVQKVSTNANPVFGSKNCPIEPFLIQTKKGPVWVRELRPNDKRGIYRAAYFDFYSNIRSFQEWADIYKDVSREDKLGDIKLIAHEYGSLLNNDNSTILIGEDSKKKIKALFTMGCFDEFKDNNKDFIDLKTGHIGTCMVDPKYRGGGLGISLLKKIIGTAQGYFTDIFVEADNNALSFYTKTGFKPLDISNPDIKRISDFILEQRDDRDTITLMSQSLDPKDPWWQRIRKPE